MDYILLSKLFYKNKDEYIKLYEQRFYNSSSYTFDFFINENPAFVVINNELLNLVTDIFRLDKQLTMLLNDLPKSAVSAYTKRALIEEVHLTNDMEGVFSTRRELEYILNNLKKTKKQRFHGLVQKYSLLDKDDIDLTTCESIRKLYDELCLKEVEEDNPKNRPDGHLFRADSVEVYNGTKSVHTGIYPESKIIEYMTKAVNILKSTDYNELVRIAVFHYMFGYIHPFYDGNGRMDRFISSYLISKLLNPLIGYGISYTVKENINDYYKAFTLGNDAKNKGDLTPFVLIFLGLIKKSAEKLINDLTDSYTKMNYYISAAEKRAESEKEYLFLQQLIYNELFGDDGMNVSQLIDKTDIGNSTVRKYIIKFSALLKSYKIGRIYYYNIDLDEL